MSSGRGRRRVVLAVAAALVGLGAAGPMPAEAIGLDNLHCTIEISVRLDPATGTTRAFSGSLSTGSCEHVRQYAASAGGGFTATVDGTVTVSACGQARLDGRLVVDEDTSGENYWGWTGMNFSVDTQAGVGQTYVLGADDEYGRDWGGGPLALAENISKVECVPPGTGGHPDIDVPGVFHKDGVEGWGPPGSYILGFDFTMLF